MANHVHFNLQVEGISEEQFESVISTETVKEKAGMTASMNTKSSKNYMNNLLCRIVK